MKKFSSFGLIAIVLLIASACSEKLDINGEFKETAVVYGLLDEADSVHFIKINRAFIGPGNALNIAKIPDSSYFKNLAVTIDEEGTSRFWTLQDTVISNKEVNGVFYGPEQKLYYFKTNSSEPLIPNTNYNLKIVVENGMFEVTSTTQLATGVSEQLSSGPLKFVENPGEYKTTIVSINSGNTYQIQGEMTVKINERISGTYHPKYISWGLGEQQTTPGTPVIFSIQGERFFNKIKEGCESSDPSVDRRTLDTITLTFTGAAEALYKYIAFNEPTSSLSQNKPTNTNLKATNGHQAIGVFSSRYTFQIKKPFHKGAAEAYYRSIDTKTTRELCLGGITGTLHFCSDHPADLSPTLKPYACN